LFTLTWKEQATPSGLRFCLLRASARRTSDTGCGSWPTPAAMDAKTPGDPGIILARRSKTLARARNGNGFGMNLAQTVAWWATPAHRDYRTPNLTAWRDRGGGKKGEQLNNQVVHSGPVLNGSSAGIASTARLNPAFSLWLMGLPQVWLWHAGPPER
jgi:hypothetical protein